MKIIIALCLCIITIFGKEISPIKVLVSVLPQKEMLEYIGGEYVKVEVLVSVGKSPEMYEPSFTQMRHIQNAQVFFGVGMPFESAWLKRFKNTNPSLIYHSLIDEQSSQTHHAHTHNPHIWLSLQTLQPRILLIADILGKIDTSHSHIFQKNAQELIAKLKNIQKRTATLLASPKAQKSFITYHPTFAYWSAEFGVQELSLEHNGKELKGKELVALITQAKGHNLKAVFIQPQFAKSRVEMFAKELGLRIIELDPLRKDWLLSLQESACQIAFSLSIQEVKPCMQEYFKD
ncbi:zinc ABC transporter substrate-binding protein [Helicobacter sp. MIT 21-1697]|uniref:metal ABC transporter solute-binding protein, Zn/Mn family n=1 Tax=Helicobacter sp. MIT 21-1697 TaxID=2993733 RepID=UPI00224AAFDE|nr:zinc ABC transporter substrate-binding protein [Helicobacter sp. MIT 21-1697]MCX2716691.1 zinc ABC transporter substrate-binding protein [Helicobacter sp. MIT 21-1697]